MFDKILIKSKTLNSSLLDISYLIYAMLFYNKVILLVHEKEIKELIHHLGPQLLEELIKANRIELKVQMNMFGVPIYSSGEKVDTVLVLILSSITPMRGYCILHTEKS